MMFDRASPMLRNTIMSKEEKNVSELQSLRTDDFLYFFLKLRKARIRKVVGSLKSTYPDESPEELARRLISSQSALSVIGGSLLHLPMLLPGIGLAWKLLGFVGGTEVLTRMHLYLILEIALLYGKDIDDQDRVQEMAAVVAATGVATGAPFLVSLLELNPAYALPAAALSSVAVVQLIGETAVRLYRDGAAEPQAMPLPA
jgi:hypothetical protein